MSMRPDQIEAALKAAKEAEVKAKASESGKSLWINKEKKTDYTYAIKAINDQKK